MTFCLDPRPLCWRCGKLAPLKCIEGIGWLCKPCRATVTSGHCRDDMNGEVAVWLKEVDAGTENACWVPCAKGDPGAREFVPAARTREPDDENPKTPFDL